MSKISIKCLGFGGTALYEIKRLVIMISLTIYLITESRVLQFRRRSILKIDSLNK